jgi:uncharacterized membrane protein YdjX (TVP38/TMEM64 family)
VLLALAAGLWLTPLRGYVEPSRLIAAARGLQQSPVAAIVVVLAFGLLSSLMVPVNMLIAATGIVFGPLVGFGYALLGTLTSAVLQFAAGAALGYPVIARVAGPRLSRLRGHLVRRGILAVATTHVLPIAPFGLLNVLAGAAGIRFRDFLFGTALAMIPGALLVAGLGGHLATLM